MAENALIIPGFLMTPQTKRMQAFAQATQPCKARIVDFSEIYATAPASFPHYARCLEYYMDAYQPQCVVAYSFGNTLLQQYIARNPAREPAVTIHIAPVGDYKLSSYGQRIVVRNETPHDVCPYLEKKNISNKDAQEFYTNLGDCFNAHRDMRYDKQHLMIIARHDMDVAPNIGEIMKTQNVTRHMIVEDDHSMRDNMVRICDAIGHIVPLYTHIQKTP